MRLLKSAHPFARNVQQNWATRKMTSQGDQWFWEQREILFYDYLEGKDNAIFIKT